MKVIIKRMIILSLAISLTSLVNAQDNTFQAAGDWTTATNWSTGKVPVTTTIGASNPAIVQKMTIDADCTIPAGNTIIFWQGSTLQINDGKTLTIAGTLTMDGTIDPGGSASTWTCSDALEYGGESYATVLIGSQCWMAENLNIGDRIDSKTGAVANDQTENGTIEKYCYNDNVSSECDTYGGLYQWDEMMQYTTDVSTQGVCPTGWHLPSNAEWTTLTDYVESVSGNLCNGNSDYIAKSLAATTNWNTSINSCAVGNDLSANNATGFSVLPGGYRDANGSFLNQGDDASLWSSTENGSYAWSRLLFYDGADVRRYGRNKAFGSSVRCVRD